MHRIPWIILRELQRYYANLVVIPVLADDDIVFLEFEDDQVFDIEK